MIDYPEACDPFQRFLRAQQNDPASILWATTYILDDYFARLGGMGRYTGMTDSEVYLFVVCRALDLTQGTDAVAALVDSRFIDAAASKLEDVDATLVHINGAGHDIGAVLLTYLEYCREQLPSINREAWSSLIERIEAATS